MSNKVQKRGLVPKLRFPEFRDAGEWSFSSLGQLFSERQESGFTKLPLLSLMDKEGIVPQEETNRKNNSSADKSKYLRVVPGDIAYNTMRMWEGRSAYVGIEGVISPAYTVCVPAVKISGIFFSYYFKTESLIGQFRRYSQGLVKDTLNLKFEAFSRIEIPYPEKEREQQKIADCLASLDERITLEAQKLDTLKTHKKGLMQQLFPAKGETLPKLRFPEFRDAGEWGYLELDSFLLGHSERVSSNTDLPIYSSTRTGLKFQKDYFDDRELENDGEYGVVPEGYFVYRHMSDDGTFKFNINKTGGKIAVSKEYPIFTTVDLHSEFLLHLLNDGDDFNEFALAQKKGGTRTRLYLKVLRTWKALLPSYPEQQKIADCLSSLDDLITAQTQKLAALKTHKKGLMQQLFPVLDEMPT